MKKSKTIVELFFHSSDLSLNPLFEELSSSPLTDKPESVPKTSIGVPRSGLFGLSGAESAKNKSLEEDYISSAVEYLLNKFIDNENSPIEDIGLFISKIIKEFENNHSISFTKEEKREIIDLFRSEWRKYRRMKSIN